MGAKNMKNKVTTSILIVSIIIIVVVGVTFAYITWTSDKINNTGTSECFDVLYVKGQDIGSDSNPANFTLASSYTEGLSSVIKVNLNDTCTILNGTGTLYLNTDSTTSSILLTSNVLKYQVLDGTNEVGSGVITSIDTIEIYSNIPITNEEKEITVYIWIDGSLVNNDNSSEILSSIYKGHISMSIESGDK